MQAVFVFVLCILALAVTQKKEALEVQQQANQTAGIEDIQHLADATEHRQAKRQIWGCCSPQCGRIGCYCNNDCVCTCPGK